jgi:hypothetical protein
MTDIVDLRRASRAVYVATEEEVARDISDKLIWAAAEIERLRAELEHLLLLACPKCSGKYLRGDEQDGR